jgi:hypothetical protein
VNAAPLSGKTLTHEERSLNVFREIYRKLDPAEIARRCNLPFDGAAFSIRIMGAPYRAAFPVFTLQDSEGREVPRGYEKILFIRYLCEGRCAAPLGEKLSYREIPWGNLYYPNFEGRCIKRFAHAFGNDVGSFIKVMEENRGLLAERLDKGAVPTANGAPTANAASAADGAPTANGASTTDNAPTHAAYRFEFFSGLFMSFFLWAADDEFPPSAQILFDDNFPSAFTAEDLSAAGAVALDHLKEMKEKSEQV